jgi:hypothetical protein
MCASRDSEIYGLWNEITKELVGTSGYPFLQMIYDFHKKFLQISMFADKMQRALGKSIITKSPGVLLRPFLMGNICSAAPVLSH